jgi:hypothetical protein
MSCVQLQVWLDIFFIYFVVFNLNLEKLKVEQNDGIIDVSREWLVQWWIAPNHCWKLGSLKYKLEMVQWNWKSEMNCALYSRYHSAHSLQYQLWEEKASVYTNWHPYSQFVWSFQQCPFLVPSYRFTFLSSEWKHISVLDSLTCLCKMVAIMHNMHFVGYFQPFLHHAKF